MAARRVPTRAAADFATTTSRSLFQDRAGAVWVGTLRGGASRIIDGRVTTWSTDDGLANNFVTAFYEDRRRDDVDRDARRRLEPSEGRAISHDRCGLGTVQQHRLSDPERRRRQPVDVLQQGDLSRESERSQCRRRPLAIVADVGGLRARGWHAEQRMRAGLSWRLPDARRNAVVPDHAWRGDHRPAQPRRAAAARRDRAHAGRSHGRPP